MPTSIFSPEHTRFILENLATDLTDSFRSKLPKGLGNFEDYILTAASNKDTLVLSRTLLYQLASSNVALHFTAPKSTEKLGTKLLEYAGVWNSQTNPQTPFPLSLVSPCALLVQRVVSNAPDIEIWEAVTNLIADFARSQTPPAITLVTSLPLNRHLSAKIQGVI